MRVSIIAFVLAAASTLRGTRSTAYLETYTFEDYERDFKRNYTSQERSMRRSLVEASLKFVRDVNRQGQSWTAGVNELTDKTEEEFASQFTGLDAGMRLGGSSQGTLLTHTRSKTETATLSNHTRALPKAIDWRKRHAVTSVMRQGACGSCWAVAAAGALEGHLAIQTGRLRKVSPGAMRDCVKNPKHCGGKGGCTGAIAQLAYKWAASQGVVFEKDYKYRAVGGTCRASKVEHKASIEGFRQLPRNDGYSLKEALAFEGPVSVSISVPMAVRSYMGGVIKCGNTKGTADWKISHAVLAVGYGTDRYHGPYWIVKNSWGSEWGESGYLRIAREAHADDEPCGTDVAPNLGFSCKPYPSKLKVCGHCGILSDSSYPIV
jgi:C1A family cysteine protease